MMPIACFLGLLLLLAPSALGFVSPSSSTQQQKRRPAATSLALSPESILLDSSGTLLSLLTQTTDPATAKGEFYFFFFAGSGAGGIGLAQVPRIYKELAGIRALADEGPSEGGASIGGGLSSLIYPTIYTKDVEKAIKKVPSCDQISKQGKSTSYLASKGYIDRDDFILSLKGCNPLASYALFEALSGGSGGVVSPVILDEKLAEYRSASNPVAAFTADLQSSTTTKLAAYGGLAFLLFLIFALIAETGITAFL